MVILPWLMSALNDMRLKYPDDEFHPQRDPHNNISWRIRYNDCPGKLYRPSSGQTPSLSNFEIHLKNRMHRKRVDDRVRLEKGRPARYYPNGEFSTLSNMLSETHL
ncbi:hypothetical protein GYMLUDRAFT_235637 [Collybiopsis luxurians FD-317 M1]|nr:hypothetical protein GYMLUDRAFT_235637 [Collybiopsis luxurians FD-317 M1]